MYNIHTMCCVAYVKSTGPPWNFMTCLSMCRHDLRVQVGTIVGGSPSLASEQTLLMTRTRF